MEDRIIKEYEEYRQLLFKIGHIKEDSFTLESFIQYLKDKNKPKPLIDEKTWYLIKTTYNGIWIK